MSRCFGWFFPGGSLDINHVGAILANGAISMVSGKPVFCQEKGSLDVRGGDSSDHDL